jgi:predicted nucleic acid-binding protein
MLPMLETVFMKVADISRKLRKQGIIIRRINDRTIAATVLE